MSAYGWTVDEVDRLPWVQTMALIEEIKHERQKQDGTEETLSRLPNVVDQRASAPMKRVVFTKTGSRLVGLVNKRTGERVI